jgi:excisionase family DNA binding protein
MAEKALPVYLSLEEAAEVMSLSVKTIRRRIADGTIPAYQCGRRPIRIRLDELEAALRRIPSRGGERHARPRPFSGGQPGNQLLR